MAKKLTEADVLEAYRAAQGMGRTEFAHALGMSKQSYSTYINKGAKQELPGLQESAIEHVGSWIGDLAVDLLRVRGAVVPCVCQTEMFDNGMCPLHGPQLSPPIIKKEKSKSTHWVSVVAA
jgi:DNA-binding XRE family transcriptional regulator